MVVGGLLIMLAGWLLIRQRTDTELIDSVEQSENEFQEGKGKKLPSLKDL